MKTYMNKISKGIVTTEELRSEYEELKEIGLVFNDSMDEYIEGLIKSEYIEELKTSGIITVEDFKKVADAFGFGHPVVTAIWNTMESNPNNAEAFETVYAMWATGRFDEIHH